MKKYEEHQLADGAIARKYNDETYLVYKKWDTRNIYIRLLSSKHPGSGIARKHLLKFIEKKRNKNIYTYVSDELGESLPLLEAFYQNHGFEPITMNKKGERVNYWLKAKN